MNNVYIITAYRSGSKESHSYVVGVFTDELTAIEIAKKEEEYRGRKYECEVIRMELDIWRDDNKKIVNPLEVNNE